MVDIQRPGYARKKRLLQTLYGTLLVIALLAVTWAFSRLDPALPGVERASVWVGEVERGSMVIEVRGNGTLVPEEIRWIAASTEGRVERILVLAGSSVRAGTTLVVLDNPELEREALGAELELKRAIAELEYLKVDLQRQLLTQQAQAASVQADYLKSQLKAEKDAEMARQGLVSELDLKLSRVTAQELSKRHRLEQERLAMNSQSLQAQLAAKEAEVAQVRGLFELRRKQVGTLQVKAGIDGVLQQTPVEVGQQINTGEILGKVAVPGRLKAELQIPETQAQDVQLGLPAVVDTRNGVVSRKSGAYRSGGPGGDGDGGRQVYRRAATRSPSGAEHRRDHPDRSAGGRAENRPPGLRSARHHDSNHPVDKGRRRSAARPGAVGTNLGDHHPGPGRTGGRRSGNAVGHIRVG